MRRTLAFAFIVLSLTGGFILRGMASEPEARPGQGAQAVKYAYVVGINQRAVICYAVADGCRTQEVTADPLTMTANGRVMSDMSAAEGTAVAKAVSILGDAGWEMVGPGPAYAHLTSQPALHFKQVAR